MHVVIPIPADALKQIFEANGWECIEETPYFYAMKEKGKTAEPFYIPRRGAVVPVETMEEATHTLGLGALLSGLTEDVLADAQRWMAADPDDD